jgi:hypothetical protein
VGHLSDDHLDRRVLENPYPDASFTAPVVNNYSASFLLYQFPNGWDVCGGTPDLRCWLRASIDLFQIGGCLPKDKPKTEDSVLFFR